MISLAFSPCPNDTYIFHALVHQCIDLGGLDFQQPILADVETLNNWAVQGTYDVTKLSFHAYGCVREHYHLLQAGAALGRGCGPLLVSRNGSVDLSHDRIAIPGALTTAAMLLQFYAGTPLNLVVMPFDTIMDAVLKGDVEAGVIIHESRFTFADLGLQSVQDLGQWWEEHSGLPIPLGGIAVKKSLGYDRIQRIDTAIAASIAYAHTHPHESLTYIRQNSQEMDGKVIQNHISLYVNSFSSDLGEEGRAAVEYLLKKGEEMKLF